MGFTVTKEEIVEAFRATHLKPNDMVYLDHHSKTGAPDCGCAVGALYVHRNGPGPKPGFRISAGVISDFLGLSHDEEVAISQGFCDGRLGRQVVRTAINKHIDLYEAAYGAGLELFDDEGFAQ
jgi:hypothetical protein